MNWVQVFNYFCTSVQHSMPILILFNHFITAKASKYPHGVRWIKTSLRFLVLNIINDNKRKIRPNNNKIRHIKGIFSLLVLALKWSVITTLQILDQHLHMWNLTIYNLHFAETLVFQPGSDLCRTGPPAQHRRSSTLHKDKTQDRNFKHQNTHIILQSP